MASGLVDVDSKFRKQTSLRALLSLKERSAPLSLLPGSEGSDQSRRCTSVRGRSPMTSGPATEKSWKVSCRGGRKRETEEGERGGARGSEEERG